MKRRTFLASLFVIPAGIVAAVKARQPLWKIERTDVNHDDFGAPKPLRSDLFIKQSPGGGCTLTASQITGFSVEDMNNMAAKEIDATRTRFHAKEVIDYFKGREGLS